MSDENEHENEEHENGGAVLDVVVEFTGDATQPEQADHLQGAEQRADALEDNCVVIFSY